MIGVLLTCALMATGEPRSAEEAVRLLAELNTAVGGFECEVSLYLTEPSHPEQLDAVRFYRQEGNRFYVRTVKCSHAEPGEITAFDGQLARVVVRSSGREEGAVKRVGPDFTEMYRGMFSPWALLRLSQTSSRLGAAKNSPQDPPFEWRLGGRTTLNGTPVLRLECHVGRRDQPIPEAARIQEEDEFSLSRGVYFLDPARGYAPVEVDWYSGTPTYADPLNPDAPESPRVATYVDRWEKTSAGIWFPVEGRRIVIGEGTSTERMVITPGTLKVRQHYSDADFRPVWKKGIIIRDLEKGTTSRVTSGPGE